MSIQFDPKNPPSNPSKESPPRQSGLCGFFHRWLDSFCEGKLMERMPSKQYCERLWEKQTGTPASKATEQFLQKCQNECYWHKLYCEWSDKN